MKKNAMLAALGLLGTPLAAQAAPITVDFSVFSVVASFGDFYPANVTGSGHFTIDDSVIPAGGTGTVFDYESGLPTLDLSFSWFGLSFDESNARVWELDFVDGALTRWAIGGDYTDPNCGDPVYHCVLATGRAPDFAVGSYFTGWLNDGEHTGLARASFAGWSIRPPSEPEPVPVPEPAALTLLGAGLAVAGLRRRRSQPG
jgi:hypothetical protein